uniref:Uncharacterized protein n=1 Tax=Antheraea pernyi nuclear polyhedrosis virus TaxID=161494 RepID=Q5I7G7_NPVAP|nr:unknown [Antheraea pernyi nucleopolyhedrovirus]
MCILLQRKNNTHKLFPPQFAARAAARVVNVVGHILRHLVHKGVGCQKRVYQLAAAQRRPMQVQRFFAKRHYAFVASLARHYVDVAANARVLWQLREQRAD